MYNFKNKMIMNAKLLKNIFVMLFTVMAFVACSSDSDDNTDYDLTRSVTNEITSKKDLPSWLVDIVENLEQIKAGANSSEIGLIYKMSNEEETFYGIYAPFTGIQHMQFYSSNGKACDITSEKQYNDFLDKVRGTWAHVYSIMNGEMVYFLGMEIPFVGLPEDMPEWLSEDLKDPVYKIHSMICQGIVDGETIYYKYNTYMSNFYGNVYDKEGNMIKTKNKNTSDYVRTGEQWVCLYNVGNSGAFVIPGWSK